MLRAIGSAGRGASRATCEHVMAKSDEPITIKKYANRRLYNTGTSTYVTLEDLATMVKAGEDFVVYRRQDRRGHHPLGAGADHLRAGEQGRAEPPADQLPAPAHPLLRRQHADAGAALSRSLDRLAHRASRRSSASRWRRRSASAAFGALEEQVRRNMEMFERAFAMFTPFARQGGRPKAGAPDKPARPGQAGRAAARTSTISSARWKRCRSGSTG